jgi:hypothetical protein
VVGLAVVGLAAVGLAAVGLAAVGLAAVKVAVSMVFAGQYGWHRDELYNLASEPVIVFDQEDPHAASFQHPLKGTLNRKPGPASEPL